METTTNSRVLIVEGSDDEHVVKHLVKRHCFKRDFEISKKGGYRQLKKSIPVEVNAPGRDALGFVADANDNVIGRWQSISGALKEAGCDVPDILPNSGSMFPGPRGLRVGVWLMPDNKSGGELENLVHEMIPKGDPILPRARSYIDQIPERDRKFTNAKLTRAYVHAWLATRAKPRPMGLAIAAGDLRHDVPTASSFVTWLRLLFELQHEKL